jgi:hypothetical protein
LEEKFSRYLVEYKFEGEAWCFELPARDRADAEARLRAMPWAQLLGEVMFSASMPESKLSRWISKLFRRQNQPRNR